MCRFTDTAAVRVSDDLHRLPAAPTWLPVLQTKQTTSNSRPLMLLCMMCRFSDTAVARVSDDFYPRDPASSSPHLAACSYNSLLMGVLIQPDWDMFHRCALHLSLVCLFSRKLCEVLDAYMAS